MAEPSYMYSLEEVAQALMIKQGIHEGLWGIAVEFTFAAMSAGPNKDALLPSAIAGISKLGLNKSEKEGPLTYDAAKLNPGEKMAPRKTKPTARRPVSKALKKAPAGA